MPSSRCGRSRGLLAGVALLCLAGCASVPEASRDPRDPWEGYNRAMFQFNDAVDRAVLKPVAQGYERYTPDPVRTSVGNFFSNLGDVGILANDALQWKFHEAAVDLTRLIMNTSFGIFGLLDVASPMGLDKNNEDFGQTLGRWGVPSGPYLVVPFWGPGTLRDAPAELVDRRIHPLYSYHEHPDQEALTALGLVDTRADLLSVERGLEGLGGDRYAAIRNAYLERRDYQVRDGAPSESDYDLLRELEAWDEE